MSWVALALVVLWIADALRLRGRLAKLPRLPLADPDRGAEADDGWLCLAAPEVSLARHTFEAAATFAREAGLEAVDLVPGDLPGESLLGLTAVLACGVGFASTDAWRAHYASWSKAQVLGNSMSAFINGSAMFLSWLGVPEEVGRTFIAFMAVAFAMTTISSATRLLRYNIEEISETVRMPALGNRYVSSLVAVAAIGFFAFFKVDGRPAGLALWALFCTTHQILGGLTLLALTLYLMQRRSRFLFTLLPMVFMLTTTIIAMVLNVRRFYLAENYLLLAVGSILLALAVWLVVEAVLRLSRGALKAPVGATPLGDGRSDL